MQLWKGKSPPRNCHHRICESSRLKSAANRSHCRVILKWWTPHPRLVIFPLLPFIQPVMRRIWSRPLAPMARFVFGGARLKKASQRRRGRTFGKSGRWCWATRVRWLFPEEFSVRVARCFSYFISLKCLPFDVLIGDCSSKSNELTYWTEPNQTEV